MSDIGQEATLLGYSAFAPGIGLSAPFRSFVDAAKIRGETMERGRSVPVGVMAQHLDRSVTELMVTRKLSRTRDP
jgi:hypothetical protein